MDAEPTGPVNPDVLERMNVEAGYVAPRAMDRSSPLDAEQAAPQKDARTGRFAPGNTIGVQFQPGTSGTPNGRPMDSTSITAEAKRLLAKPGQGNRLNATLVAEKLLSMALAGNVEALRYLGDRTDGKPAQAVTLSLDEGPLHHRLNVIDGGPRLSAAPPADDADAPS